MPNNPTGDPHFNGFFPVPVEPDPESGDFNIEQEARMLEYAILQNEIIDCIKRGQVNQAALVRKYYDPTNAFHSKEIIAAIVKSAFKEAAGDLKGHDVYNEVLGYWLQSNMMIEVQNDAIKLLHERLQNGERVSMKDLTALINANAALWKDRFSFMRFMGLVQPGMASDTVKSQLAPESSDMSKIFDELEKEADEFEGVKALSNGEAL